MSEPTEPESVSVCAWSSSPAHALPGVRDPAGGHTYDAFILEEDGQLNELLVQEIRDLGINLRGTPRIVTVTSGREGLACCKASLRHGGDHGPLADMAVEAFPGTKEWCPGCRWSAGGAPWRAGAGRLRAAGPVNGCSVAGHVNSLFAMASSSQEDRRTQSTPCWTRAWRAIIVVEDDVPSTRFPPTSTQVTTRLPLWWRAHLTTGSCACGPAQDPLADTRAWAVRSVRRTPGIHLRT